MNQFDQRARTWDINPIHWDRSSAIAGKMKQYLKLPTNQTALEYGAGTGILSFLLKDSLKEITLMDNSMEMVRVMEEKIKDEQVAHLKPLFFNLEETAYQGKNFDLVFTQMVLHHVGDVRSILAKFYDLLTINGHLVIADLYPEDGSFHGSDFTGHLGFDVENLSQTLLQIGFKNIRHEPCFVMKKQTESHGIKEFPVFFLIATK